MSQSHRRTVLEPERPSACSQRPRTHHVPAMPLPNTFETLIPNSPERQEAWSHAIPSPLGPRGHRQRSATGTLSDLLSYPGSADGQPPDRALQTSAQPPGATLHSNTSSLTCIRSLFQNFYTCSYTLTRGVSRTHVTVRPMSSAGWVLLALHRYSQTTAGCHRLLCKTLHFGPKLSGWPGTPHKHCFDPCSPSSCFLMRPYLPSVNTGPSELTRFSQ